MARTPKSETPNTAPLTLQQFAALEAWVEAAAKLAGLNVGKPGVQHAPVITEVYKARQRAMQLLTGAKPTAEPEDDSDLA